jgi:hypothetical protein
MDLDSPHPEDSDLPAAPEGMFEGDYLKEGSKVPLVAFRMVLKAYAFSCCLSRRGA